MSLSSFSVIPVEATQRVVNASTVLSNWYNKQLNPLTHQEDHDCRDEPAGHLAVDKLEVVNETIFVGAAINTADKVT